MISIFSRYPYNVFNVIVVVFVIFLNVAAEWEYQRLARILHNVHRGRHTSKSLYSTKDLNRRAEKCAEYYVRLGNIDHSCPYVYSAGENIWAYWGGRQTDSGATRRSIDSWYREEKFYRYKGSQRGTGHFTQMVWQGTRAMGFGVARRGHMVVAVGIYWPAGNYVGEYTKNVWRPYYKKRYG